MARTPDVFGDGTISTVPTILAGPVPLTETWYVTQLKGRNTGAAAVTVTFFLNVNGVNREVDGGIIDASGGSYDLTDKALLLGPGDILLASATVADVLTYYAAGIRSA